MNNGNYNKNTKNNKQSNSNFIGKNTGNNAQNKRKNFGNNAQNNSSRDDIYSPKVYPKKQKVSKFDAILDSLNMPEYMSVKNEANAKRERDLKYKRDRRR